jgi:two-component system, OmpR family, sensor histidine kinase KdpD
VLVALLLVAVTVGIVAVEPAPQTLWRHLYLAPVVIAGVRYGGPAAVVTALASVLLFGPIVLREIERAGAIPAVCDALVTFVILLLAGALTGALAARARRQRCRYEAVLAAQRLAAEPAPLGIVLVKLRAVLQPRLDAAAVGLVIVDGDEPVVSGGARLALDSVAARVIAGGEPRFVPDTGGESRPRRALVVPLTAGGRTIGALALERHGDIAREERDALAGLGAALGLALDNARLAARQRRFADELERKVGEATARLAEMDRLKSELVALASHELRTPLTAIQGFSELLATRPFATGEVRRVAEIVCAEAERLGRIVADFLDIARLERGLPLALRCAPLDPAPVITEAVELFRRTRTTHRLELQLDGALPRIDADADALDRVLKNLISNALKYSPAGSCVHVRARPAPGAIAVEVEDEGPGVAVDDLVRIFEPYYRAPSTARLERGTGLGLAVVKSLVEAHGGTIRAERGAGRGTRMTFVIPAVS